MENQNNQQNIQQNQTQNQPKQTSSQFKLPQGDYAKMDEKTIATIKASAIWNAVVAAIISVAGMLAAYYFTKNLYGAYSQYLGTYLGQVYKPQIINIGALINDILWGAVGGAVAGWVIAKFYPVFVGWQKKYVGNKLNTFFKILFYPYLAGFAISLVLGGALSMMNSGFNVFLIVVVADAVAAYLYAKMMDKAVGKYYK